VAGGAARAALSGAAPEGVEELAIESLAAGGAGVGRAADGRVVFVPDTAPGDRVRVRLVARHRRHAEGRLEELLVPGPARVEPPCPVFGTCGGCAWQHLAYPAQLEAKAGILRDALARIGGLTPPRELRIVPSPAPYAYRRRARVLVRGGRTGFRRRRSNELCATARCPVLVPALEEALAELAAEAPPDGEWELLAGEGEARRSAPGRRGAPLAVRAGGDLLRVSPGVFVQSNGPLLDPLLEAVHTAAGRGRTALELYAGAGFLTLGLARRFERVVAVEAHAAAARDLGENCRAAGLANVEIRRARVEAALAAPGDLPQAPDALVLDPPRSGLGRGGAEALAGLRPGRIVLLSCAPATLARDLGALARSGYFLSRIEGFDLFPQTPHLEALAVVEPPGARNQPA